MSALLAHWVTRLVPARHKQAAALAELEAVQSRTVMRHVAARGAKVEELTTAMAQDREINHFAERVAEAIGRTYP